jgi:hypothetical protein
MNCSGGQVLFIEKGNYGKVKLDGLAIATMGQSPEGQTMMESYGNWNFAYYYIDEKANPEQRKALEAIAGKVLTPDVSKKTETRYVPITRKIEGKEHQITIGQYGTFHGHLVEGGMGGSPKIVNPPGADRSITSTRRGAPQRWLITMQTRIGRGRTRITCWAHSASTTFNTKNSPPVSPRKCNR